MLINLASLSCAKKEFSDLPEDTISLEAISSDSRYEGLKLENAYWKLVGFADERLNQLRFPQPKGGYMAVFGDNGRLSESTPMNEVKGTYTVDPMQPGRLEITQFSPITFVNEMGDSYTYSQAMTDVFRYTITSRGLLLYYTETKFLLFQLPYFEK